MTKTTTLAGTVAGAVPTGAAAPRGGTEPAGALPVLAQGAHGKSAVPAQVLLDRAWFSPDLVGNLWIGFSRPHWGIHGTPEPAVVGRSETNGCLHLTNWDAAKVATLVSPGFVVDVQEQ